ncbi:MAG: hypothetical protein H8E66_01725 [Planctomycetes bacterium]|nr:hypothetical protein [Planctomycetota bacterium]
MLLYRYQVFSLLPATKVDGTLFVTLRASGDNVPRANVAHAFEYWARPLLECQRDISV